MSKVVIPKSTHFGHIIKDSKLLELIQKRSKDQAAKTVIDQMTRKYLRQKHPTRVIEGQERVNGRITDVWYNYE